MEKITVYTWTGKESLTMGSDCFTLYWMKQEKTIPFSQVISFSLRDPKSKMRPGMITLQLGGTSDSSIRVTSFLSVGNSQNIEFPHAYDYLDDGREMQRRFSEWQRKSAAPSATSNQTVADEIRSYKALLDEGIITQEEFDAKKKQLLGI